MTLGQGIFLSIVAICAIVGWAYRAKVAVMAEWCKASYKEVKVEMRKVTWPAKHEMVGSTLIVMVMVVVLAVLIGIGDAVLAKVVGLVLTGGSGQ